MLGLLRAGGVFLGGFIAAVIAGVVLIRRYQLPGWRTMDAIIPSLALGHAIGRIGCLMAGCCWGRVCDLPWAVTYTDPQAAANVGTPLHIALHPFPAYAAIFNFALYGFLEWLYGRRLAPGRVFASYLMLYGVGPIRARSGPAVTRPGASSSRVCSPPASSSASSSSCSVWESTCGSPATRNGEPGPPLHRARGAGGQPSRSLPRRTPRTVVQVTGPTA